MQGRSILFYEASNLSISWRQKLDHICEYPVVPRCCNSSFSVHFSAENPKPHIKPSVDPNPTIPIPGAPSIPPEIIPNYPHDPRIPQNPDSLLQNYDFAEFYLQIAIGHLTQSLEPGTTNTGMLRRPIPTRGVQCKAVIQAHTTVFLQQEEILDYRDR